MCIFPGGEKKEHRFLDLLRVLSLPPPPPHLLERIDSYTGHKYTRVTSKYVAYISFLPLNCCLSVVLSFDKGTYSKNSRVVWCH